MNEHLTEVRNQVNQWGRDREPFLLLADFELEQVQCLRLSDIDPDVLRFSFNEEHEPASAADLPELQWSVDYPSAEAYEEAYSVVQKGLHRGDSFLLNLTFPSEVSSNWTLKNIYEHTKARYKVWWKDQFVVFSPEIFVQMREGKIYSYPMKGTLPGHLPGNILLDDPKEQAEHATIVDLIRNDLSQVAKKVRVSNYRYLEQIETTRGGLWQTSSEIVGELPQDYHLQLGDLLFKLLPAGSISGAPKTETVRIIQDSEKRKRGFYTGIAAYWDGYKLDSCVLIRFLEQTSTGLRYWSGGGITAYSDPQQEYKELKEKVYLPVHAASQTSLTAAARFD